MKDINIKYVRINKNIYKINKCEKKIQNPNLNFCILKSQL